MKFGNRHLKNKDGDWRVDDWNQKQGACAQLKGSEACN